MKQSKRRKLEAAGWQIGSAADFLGLSTEEESLIDIWQWPANSSASTSATVKHSKVQRLPVGVEGD